MSQKILILSVLMVAVLVSSGCTQSANLNIGCEPDYINAGSDFLQHSLLMSREDACKKACFDGYSVSSYELKEECRCDVNDCGEVIISYCGDGGCKEYETCRTCETDCGKCPPSLVVHNNEQEVYSRFELKEIGGENHLVAYKSKMGDDISSHSHNLKIPIEFTDYAENIKGVLKCTSSLTYGGSSMTSIYLEQNSIISFECDSKCVIPEVVDTGSGIIIPTEITKAYKNSNAKIIASLFFKSGYVTDGEILMCSVFVDVEFPKQNEVVNLYPIMIVDDT